MRRDRHEKLDFGPPAKSPKSGKVGSRVFLSIMEGGHHAVHEFDTYGLTPTETANLIREHRKWHTAWATRQTRFASVRGTEFTIRGDVFRIVDCTIPPDRPYEDVELIVGIRKVSGDRLERVPGWPISLWYTSIAEVPRAEQIADEVQQRLRMAADQPFELPAELTRPRSPQ